MEYLRSLGVNDLVVANTENEQQGQDSTFKEYKKIADSALLTCSRIVETQLNKFTRFCTATSRLSTDDCRRDADATITRLYAPR